MRNPRAWKGLIRKRGLLFSATFGLLVAVAWLAYKHYSYYSAQMATFGYSLLAFFYACCLLIALLKTPVLERALCNKWLIELGGISYCVYLIHLPLIRAGWSMIETAFKYSGVHLKHEQVVFILAGSALGIGLTIAIAKLSWRFLEQPMLRRGHTYKY